MRAVSEMIWTSSIIVSINLKSLFPQLETRESSNCIPRIVHRAIEQDGLSNGELKASFRLRR